MGTRFLQKNERHAAWERSCRGDPHRPVQTDRSQEATQGTRRRPPKLIKGARRVLEIIAPERPTRKTELQDMERTTSVAHGYTEGAAKHATRKRREEFI